MKSIHVLAAELAKLVPTLQADSIVNNEQLFLGKLKEADLGKTDLIERAEVLLCNALPMSHCSQVDWDKLVKEWRDKMHV